VTTELDFKNFYSKNIKSENQSKKVFIFADQFNAQVAELVDALDSKSSSARSAGSIPALGTKKE
jgi:hypothetical protein